MALAIKLKSNSAILPFLNIKPLTSQMLVKTDYVWHCGLEDTFLVHKIVKKILFCNLAYINYWFNSYGNAVFIKKADVILPIYGVLEEAGVFVSSEERIQKAEKILPGLSMARSLSTLLQLFLPVNRQILYFSFFRELLDRVFLFTKKNSSLSFSFSWLFFREFDLIGKYPIKPLVNNFYCTNNVTKNSDILVKALQNTRSLYNNFN